MLILKNTKDLNIPRNNSDNMSKSKTYGILSSSRSVGKNRTIRGNEWVESILMTKDIKIVTQMGEDDIVYLHLKEVHDASGDLLIRSIRILPDGTIEPLN